MNKLCLKIFTTICFYRDKDFCIKNAINAINKITMLYRLCIFATPMEISKNHA